jgi:hypothetical protein
MTTEAKNVYELIRYPVAVRENQPWMIRDASGKTLAHMETYIDSLCKERAAEIVRVLNAYGDLRKTLEAVWDRINSTNIDFYQITMEMREQIKASLSTETDAFRTAADIEAANPTPKPAPVAASGEPSDAAVRIRQRMLDKWQVSIGNSVEYSAIIDAAFAADRAEAARKIQQLETDATTHAQWIDTFKAGKIAAERERDEARAELANARKLADGYNECNKIDREAFVQMNKEACAIIAQLRADLDEAVGLLNYVYPEDPTWRTNRMRFLERLNAKPSEPDAVELPEIIQHPTTTVNAPPGPPAMTMTTAIDKKTIDKLQDDVSKSNAEIKQLNKDDLSFTFRSFLEQLSSLIEKFNDKQTKDTGD